MTAKERGFNVPRTVRDSVKDALTTDRDHLMPHELSIAEEIASGKVVYKEHIEWLQEFFSAIDVQYLLHGGDSAREWLDKVDSPEAIVSSGFSGRDDWVFFVTGPTENSPHADSVFSVDPKTEHLFAWTDKWEDRGSVYTSDIDRPMVMEVDFTTAKGVAEWSMRHPSTEDTVNVRTLDPVEYNIFRKAEFGLDYKLLDRVTEYITVPTGEDPDLIRKRSKNAQGQVRDSSGRFGGGGSSSSGSAPADGGSTPQAVGTDGNKPETTAERSKRLAGKFQEAVSQLDSARTDEEAVHERIESGQVRATLDKGTRNSAQSADVFLKEFQRGEADEVDNRDKENRPKTTFADEASYEPDPDAIAPTDISGLPESSRAFTAIVDKDDQNAVLNLAVLAKVEGKIHAFVRMNSAWYSAPELLSKFQSTDPPFLVELEDEEQIASVIEQIDSGDLGAEDREEEEAPESDEEAIAAAMAAYYEYKDESHARDAVILASMTGNHHLLTREIVLASGLGLLDARATDDYGMVLVSAGVPGIADTPSDYAAVRRLKNYWLHGAGSAKIRWGAPGDWGRCNRNLTKYMGARAKGYCQKLHFEAVGYYTGDKRNK